MHRESCHRRLLPAKPLLCAPRLQASRVKQLVEYSTHAHLSTLEDGRCLRTSAPTAARPRLDGCASTHVIPIA